MMKKLFCCLLLLMFLSAGFAAKPIRFTRIDKNHSTIGFSVPILNGFSKVTGKFMDFEVEMIYDETDLTNSSVQITINTASINTGIEDRDNHLRSGDFFEVAKFPQITFKSERVEKRGAEVVAIGNLTLRGITKEITVPFTINGLSKYESEDTKGEMRANLGASAEFTLNRLDYGIEWQHNNVPQFVGNEITVEINLITRSTKIE